MKSVIKECHFKSNAINNNNNNNYYSKYSSKKGKNHKIVNKTYDVSNILTTPKNVKIDKKS